LASLLLWWYRWRHRIPILSQTFNSS